MARGESNADPYSIFAEEYGVDTYEALVRKNPRLKDHTVEFISWQAVGAATENLSPLETAGLDQGIATRVLAAVMSARTLLPLAEGTYHDHETSRITEISREDERAEQDLAERIYHASLDPRIVDCILSGEEEDALIAHLQLDYHLTEQQARNIIRDVGYKIGEIVDYGDEA